MNSLPPGQQLVAPGKWPIIGERKPADDASPWTVSISGLVERQKTWTLNELRSMSQVEQTFDLHCVTRWSKPGVPLRGVPLEYLLEPAVPTSEAAFVSFIARSERGHSTSLSLADARSLGVLLALDYDGKPLPVEHGGPVRVIVPGRYLYKSLKWLARIDVLAEDRLGYWESTAGYHNHADPLHEERYIAAGVSMQEMRRLLATRDLSGRDLLGLAAAGHDLNGLVAREALLRNSDFRGCILSGACFDRANLSNADFRGADLRQATFIGADLEGAELAGADLRGADFTGAALTAASFQSPPLAAILDPSTRFEKPSLEGLMPAQFEFIQRSGCYVG
jgi:DMSO/TMAO reductase YedYZ molybdopterin-dependent catalytic subunit